MGEKAWYELFFGEDYLEIYEDVLPAKRTSFEVEGILSLLELDAGARDVISSL